MLWDRTKEGLLEEGALVPTQLGLVGGPGALGQTRLHSSPIPMEKRFLVGGYFPGGPVVKIPHFHCMGHGFDPWSGN